VTRPRIRARAPLRVSFAGGGTDVPPFPELEGGCVLSATIDRYADGSLVPRTDRMVTIESVNFKTTAEMTLDNEILCDGSLDLIKAAVRRFCLDGTDVYDLVLRSSAPPGSGLGSSSTMMVALTGLLAEHYGAAMGTYQQGADDMDGVSGSDIVAPSMELAQARLAEAITVKQEMLAGRFAAQAVEVARLMISSLRAGGKVIFFGNGGSAQDAGHLAAELMGRFAFDRPGLAAISLPDATAAMTAIGNDYSYDEVFARQVLAAGRPGDVVVGLSTSGDSLNVVRGLEAAGHGQMSSVAMTGARGGKAASVADVCIQVPSDNTARVQEACLHLGHTICEMVEAAVFARPS
jgi:D-sedoheptulose 7-phosphate isomerase